MSNLGPRLVIAGTASGVGKTTIATGLMAAFRRAGVRVASAKVGPDFIDPGYHSVATGRPGRNLDAFLSGEDLIAPLAGRASADSDLLIVEGVMGLFDGSADDGAGSTAHVARLLEAPVVLVVDARSMSQSVAALVAGFRNFDPTIHVAGVILNRVGSDAHEVMLRDALTPLGVPIFGVMRRNDDLVWRDRHLGLVPVIEHMATIEASLDRLAERIASSCDLVELERLARSAAVIATASIPMPERVGRTRVAIAGGPAFSFSYVDNLESLQAAGAELIPFDPRVDRLPDGVQGLVAGGGFPEVYAEELAANSELLERVRHDVGRGLVTWAECGGLLWLCEKLGDVTLAGVIPACGVMTKRLHLGYRRATVLTRSPLGLPRTQLRGHEFHYSTVTPAGDAVALESRFATRSDGFATPSLLATYLHVHLASRPDLAEAFVRACAASPVLAN